MLNFKIYGVWLLKFPLNVTKLEMLPTKASQRVKYQNLLMKEVCVLFTMIYSFFSAVAGFVFGTNVALILVSSIYHFA